MGRAIAWGAALALLLVINAAAAQQRPPSCEETSIWLRQQLGRAQIDQGQYNLFVAQVEDGTLLTPQLVIQRFEKANPGKTLVNWTVVEKPAAGQ